VSYVIGTLLTILLSTSLLAQDAPQAIDVTSADIQKFINALQDAASLETDIEYRIFRPDPDNRLSLK